MVRRISELLLPALVLGILLLFTYARFYMVSYIGFEYNAPTGEVRTVFDLGAEPQLVVGELILRVNGTAWEDFSVSHRSFPLTNAKPGETLALLVAGESGQREVQWRVVGFNTPEFTNRLLNTWPLSYVFWLAGTASLVLLRPRDLRRALLVAFNYVTAIWILAGTMSNSGILDAPFVMRAGIWLSAPIYLHFHYSVPSPLGKPYPWRWLAAYLLAGGLALAQWLEWLPYTAYYAGLLAAVTGSLALLIYRFVKRPQERREIGLLLIAAAIALLPTLVVALSSRQLNSSIIWPGSVLSLIALPGAYFYVVFRRQLGGMEFRANRLISIYLFLVLLAILGLFLIPLLGAFFREVDSASFAILLSGLITSVISIFAFPRFQTFVERRLLGIPQPPQHILEGFAGRISTSFSRQNLAESVTQTVLPSLLVRQSALVDFEGSDSKGRVVYLQNLTQDQLPTGSQLKQLPTATVLVRRAENLRGLGAAADWIQVVLPLTLAGQPRGAWLLGRKDPDDYYSQAELSLLRSLADQITIALANITQARSLRALHQADIERQEVERKHLAHELHDDVLHRINDLSEQVADGKGFKQQLEDLIGQVRILINGLRPPLMDQGLYFALLNLTDELGQHPANKSSVKLDLPLSYLRFDPTVEQHLYRIVQQACENALQHSQCKQLVIRGSINQRGAELVVEDDGRGFKVDGDTHLAALLATRHFGLAGMQERAAMIDAHLSVDSSPGSGTRVLIVWQAAAVPENS